VNLLRWGLDAPQGVCLVQRWDYASAQQRFEPVQETRLQASR
jgi:hypothetical protein